MKKFIPVFIISLLAFSCGNEGVGFNIRKEFPVVIPVDIDPVIEWTLPGIDPPPASRSSIYSLQNAGYDDLDNMDTVLVKDISYQITGIDAAEQFSLDSISITLRYMDNLNVNQIAHILIATSNLQNVSKTSIATPQVLEALQKVLADKKDVITLSTFDFAEVPNSSISFNFTLYIDAVVKIRDLQ